MTTRFFTGEGTTTAHTNVPLLAKPTLSCISSAINQRERFRS